MRNQNPQSEPGWGSNEPSAGETIQSGVPYDVQWDVFRVESTSLQVSYSRDDGRTFATCRVAGACRPVHACTWTNPGPLTDTFGSG